MARQKNFRTDGSCPGYGGVEVFDLEPQKNSIAATWVSRIADPAMVMLLLPSVQLKDQPPANFQSIVVRPALCTHAAQKLLVPAAAGFDIIDADERLRAHGCCAV